MITREDLVKALKHEPTEQQLNLFRKLHRFLVNPDDDSCFIITGYAGTGKTTVISALVKILPKYGFKSVLLAPTGRAAKVIAGYSARNASTIHRKIYRKRAAVTPDMQFMLNINLHSDTLFIVDEASMISDELSDYSGSSLIQDLVEYVYNQKNCRLLLVGDTAQLPPVGSDLSPALNKEFLTKNFRLSVTDDCLTDVVRQSKRSGILENATTIREHIRKEVEAFPRLFVNETDTLNITGNQLIEALSFAFDKYGEEETLVVCRSNKNAYLYNRNIRTQLLWREDEITGGDQVMIVKNNYFWMPEELGGFIANGEMAKITRVRNIQEMYGFRFAEVTLEFRDFGADVSLDCKVMLDTLYSETSNLSSADSQRFYKAVLEDYIDVPNKRERYELMKKNPYFNALQIKFAYAVTCHKAQGGQWNAVFVDQGYLTDEMVDRSFLRWLYTATTRAKQALYYVNFSDEFYGIKK